jgi:hypothetical protein
MTVTSPVTTDTLNNTGNSAATRLQGRRRPSKEQFVNDFSNMLSSKLNLSDEQLNKIKTILKDNMPEPGANGQTPGSAQAPDKTKIDELNSKIESVLTAEQKTTFESLVKEMEQKKPKFQPNSFMNSSTQGTNATGFSSILLNTIKTSGAQQVNSSNSAVDFYS